MSTLNKAVSLLVLCVKLIKPNAGNYILVHSIALLSVPHSVTRYIERNSIEKLIT